MASSEGLPATTILIGTAAAAVFAAAGYVAMSGDKEKSSAHPEVTSASSAPSSSAPKKDLVPPNPYGLTSRYRDAKARAELWNPKAVLTRIVAISKDGSLTNELTFDFGVPTGRLLGSVEKTLKSVQYKGDDASESTTPSSAGSHAMPEPNCPLENAIVTLKSTSENLPQQFGILYDYSEKHHRPVWSFTRSEGAPIYIDADNCVLLLR